MSNMGLATGPGAYEESTLIIEAGGLHQHDDEMLSMPLNISEEVVICLLLIDDDEMLPMSSTRVTEKTTTHTNLSARP